MEFNRLKLIIPTQEYKEQMKEFIDEFKENGEETIYGSGKLERLDTYEEWLQKINEDLNKQTAEEKGRVQAAQYIAVRKEDNKVIGIIQLRYTLNEKLYNHGGHIGDSIRPSERNNGYSTEMIWLALQEAKKVGIGNVLMTCDKDNIASARTIIKNDGVLENEVEYKGKIIQRYWITLKKRFADWRHKSESIVDKTYKNLRIDNDEFKGNISLLEMNKVKSPWYADGDRCILNDKFKWLEVYPDGAKYCITVIYNENEKVVEWYHDIARSTGEEGGVPYEDDLYLDVVVTPDGKVNLLDEDELQEAYDKKEVSDKDYDMAYKVANELIEKYQNDDNINRLSNFSNKYLEILKK